MQEVFGRRVAGALAATAIASGATGAAITAVDGTRVSTGQQLRGLIDGRRPGAVVRVTVARRSVSVMLRARS